MNYTTTRDPAEAVRALIQALNGVLLGKEPQIKLAPACLIGRGHLLIEDLPGMGKTTLSHALARALGLGFTRVQFTSDMLPATFTPTNTLTRTNTSTPTATFTSTNTPTPTETFTPGPSPTPTDTPTHTATATATFTPTATSVLPDLIFADDFESGDLSAWTSSTTDLGDLSVSPAAALVGRQGMQALINDTNTIYVTDDRPAAEPHYRARFYFNPNAIAMASGNAHYIFKGFTSALTEVLRVQFGRSSNAYQFRAYHMMGIPRDLMTPYFCDLQNGRVVQPHY